MVLANYLSDLGVLFGVYDLFMSPMQGLYLSLPQRQKDQFLFLPDRRTKGCRTEALKPRKVILDFQDNSEVFVELPLTPTLEEVREIKNNTNAIAIKLVGEKMAHSALQHYYG